jgi:hypothetical protein
MVSGTSRVEARPENSAALMVINIPADSHPDDWMAEVFFSAAIRARRHLSTAFVAGRPWRV